MTPAGDERRTGAPEQLARQLEEVAANVGSVLYGKRDVVRLTLACLATSASPAADAPPAAKPRKSTRGKCRFIA